MSQRLQSAPLWVRHSWKSHLRLVGGYFGRVSRETRVMWATECAARGVATRRARYGPSGRRTAARLAMIREGIIAESGLGDWPGLYDI